MNAEAGAGLPAAEARLFERDAELARIESALDVVAGGAGACLLFSGPGGVGKTTLIGATRAAAGDRGIPALWAGGAELEREFAFGIVRQLFEPALARMPRDERNAALDGAAGGAAAILGGDAAGPAGEADDGFAALHSLYWFAVALADRGPLALVVDDAHLADPPSLRFLAFLARRLEGHPILLAVGARDDASGGGATGLAELGATPVASIVTPSPLGLPGVAALLSAELGREPDDGFAEACLGATGGNPFLLRELAKTISSEGMEPTAPNAVLVDRLGPASVSRAVLARLAALGPETVELARSVAILGGRADVRDAAMLAGLDEGDASAAADTLVGAGVFERGRPIEFVHAIVRQAIYEDIAPGERAAAHGRAARLLADRLAEPERVASHLLSAEPARDQWAYDRLTEAADRALSRGSPGIAIDFLRRALEEPPREAVRPELLARLGSIEVRAGRRAGVPRLRDAHATTIDPAARAAIARELGGALLFSGHATEAAALLVHALDELEGTVASPDVEMLARLESLLLAAGVATSGGHELARSRYATLERRIGELPDSCARLVSAPLALERITCGGTAAIGIHLASRALGDGRLMTEEGAESPLLLVAVAALLWADRVAEAEATTSAAVSRVEAEGSARGLVLTLPSRALARLRRGALADAGADARQAIALGDETGAWLVFRMIAAAVAATVLLERGDLADAEGTLDAVADIPHDPDAVLTQPLREARARLWMARGEPERALSVLAPCRDRERTWDIRAVVPIPWRSLTAQAQHAMGHSEEARGLAAEELQLAELFDAPRPIGVAKRTLGLIEGGDDGIELLREAADCLTGSSDRLEHARALVDLGATLRREGHKSDAREPLREGLEAARACGATALAERAYEELRATGARPRKILYSGVEALTPSERRVASMAADGMSNREIAQALFVTLKTVEVHLSHAYAKLEISSRKELPRALGTATEAA